MLKFGIRVTSIIITSFLFSIAFINQWENIALSSEPSVNNWIVQLKSKDKKIRNSAAYSLNQNVLDSENAILTLLYFCRFCPCSLSINTQVLRKWEGSASCQMP